jgi:hypothetical protein
VSSARRAAIDPAPTCRATKTITDAQEAPNIAVHADPRTLRGCSRSRFSDKTHRSVVETGKPHLSRNREDLRHLTKDSIVVGPQSPYDDRNKKERDRS